MHEAKIGVEFIAQESLVSGLGEGNIKVELANGSNLAMPITWNIHDKGVFELENYFLVNLAQDEKRVFQINCNLRNEPDAEIRIEGSGLRILEVRRNENNAIVTIECIAKTINPNDKIGELLVKGVRKNYILPIIDYRLE